MFAAMECSVEKSAQVRDNRKLVDNSDADPSPSLNLGFLFIGSLEDEVWWDRLHRRLFDS